jgi:putative hydrolase of the HAD superfamily
MDPTTLRTRPSVVLLDVGDTMLRPEPSWPAVYASVFPEFGVRAAPADFERAFREAWLEWETEGPFEATEEASFHRLMDLDQRIFVRLGYPDLPEAFFRAVEAAFHRRSAWFIYPDVTPALDALRAAGMRLAVVSNWGWAAPELLHLLELASHFEAFAISARVGYQKPHPAIFEHALELLGARPADAIHVGDNPEADVVGARRAGVEPVLIDRGGAHDEPRERAARARGAPVIGDLLELLDLLGIARPAVAAIG